MTVSGATPLLERGEELEALRLHLARAASDGGIAVIAGAGGIGKTRLLKAVRLEAADLGLRVAVGALQPAGAGFAFGVVRQVFEPVLAEPAVQDALAGPAAPAAAALPARAARRTAPSRPTRVLDALHRLTLAVAERPGRRAGRRPAVVRRAVAALAGVPRAAPGGHAAGRASRRWPAGPGRSTGASSASSSTTRPRSCSRRGR